MTYLEDALLRELLIEEWHSVLLDKAFLDYALGAEQVAEVQSL